MALAGWSYASPAVQDGVVFFSTEREFVALDSRDGSVYWRTSFGRNTRVIGVREAGSLLFVAEGTDD